MYLYLKAVHIIFVVTWFAGMFYIVRLFIYNTEANSRPAEEKKILQGQLSVMIRRLWFGITWPSAIITAVLGPWIMFTGIGYGNFLDTASGRWLLIKIIFVFILYIYHFSLHRIYKEESKGLFKYSSNQLRIWNEVATVLLVAIVMLATVKESISWVWGVIGIIAMVIILMAAISIYKKLRKG
jgi:protoporphyrinogen IX oxidase